MLKISFAVLLALLVAGCGDQERFNYWTDAAAAYATKLWDVHGGLKRAWSDAFTTTAGQALRVTVLCNDTSRVIGGELQHQE